MLQRDTEYKINILNMFNEKIVLNIDQFIRDYWKNKIQLDTHFIKYNKFHTKE